MRRDDVKAVVLAAGKGTRLQAEGSDLPKVLRLAGGKPLLRYVVSALDFLPREDIILVVGWKKEAVMAAFPGHPFAHQDQQLGTGHAVACAAPLLEGFDGHVLVCCGDTPLVRQATFAQLVQTHLSQKNDCTLLSAMTDAPETYGRIVRDEDGSFSQIIEFRDCTAQQATIREVNTGIYVFHAPALLQSLGQLDRNNAQREFYLTDVPCLMKQAGLQIGLCDTCTQRELMGVNTAQQLSEAERLLKEETYA